MQIILKFDQALTTGLTSTRDSLRRSHKKPKLFHKQKSHEESLTNIICVLPTSRPQWFEQDQNQNTLEIQTESN